MVPALTARRCTRPDSHHITSSRSMFFHQSPGLWVAQWFVQRSVRLHTGNKSLRCSEKTWGCTDAVPRLTEPPTYTLLPRHSEEHAKRCTSPWCHEVDHWWAELFLGVSRSLLVPRPSGGRGRGEVLETHPRHGASSLRPAWHRTLEVPSSTLDDQFFF